MREYSRETIERIHNLYSVIANRQLGNTPESLNTRVNIVRELERLTRQQFESTADFHSKITGILVRKEGINHRAPDAK